MLTGREQQVLDLIRQDPMLSQQGIAERLGISRSAAAGHIMNISNKGYIRGRGYVLSDAPFVTVVGGANIDIHGRSSQRLRRDDSNPGEVTVAAGGVARNVAENLARLGVDCRLISALGNDHHGRMLRRLSAEAGIDMQHVHEIESAPTSTYLAVLDDAGAMQFAISDMSIIDQLGPEKLQRERSVLSQSSLIVVDANLSAAALAWLTAAAGDVPIFADAVSTAKAPRLKPQLHAMHTLKASAAEAEALTGMPAQTPAQLRLLAAKLHADGVERVFVTRGELGVFYSAGGDDGCAKPRRRKRDVRNTGGAGDAFLAGLAYAWLECRSLAESLRFALATADITLSHAASSNPALSLDAVGRALAAGRG